MEGSDACEDVNRDQRRNGGGGSDIPHDRSRNSRGSAPESNGQERSGRYESEEFQARLIEFAAQSAHHPGGILGPPASIQVPSDDITCASSVTTAHFQDAEIFGPSMYPSTEGIENEANHQTEAMEPYKPQKTTPLTSIQELHAREENILQKEKGFGRAKASFLEGSKESAAINIGQMTRVVSRADSSPPPPDLDTDSGKISKTLPKGNQTAADPISPLGKFRNVVGSPSSRINLPRQTVNSFRAEMFTAEMFLRQECKNATTETGPMAPKGPQPESEGTAPGTNNPTVGTGLFARIMGFETANNSINVPPREPVLPGAYPVQPYDSHGETEHSEWENQEWEELHQTTDNSGLVVARPLELEIATPQNVGSTGDIHGVHNQNNGGIFKGGKLGVGICLLVVIAAICGVLVFYLDIGLFGTDPAKLRHTHVRSIIEDAFGSDYFDTEQKEKALHWIVYEDPLHDLQVKRDAETNNDGLLQRFSLVSFYFQTSFQNPWPHCSPPMAGQSEICYYDVNWGRGKPQEYRGTRWLSAAHECNWMDIECTGDSKVTQINLVQKKLTGVIPSDISRLSGLTKLDLRGNMLSGPLPDWISRLSSLEQIWLGFNHFSGAIPPEYLALEWLVLSNNLLTGTIPVGSHILGKNKVLCLDNNLLSGSLPSMMYSMSQLERLSLANNNLGGTLSSEVGKLSKLQDIFLEGNLLLGNLIPSEIGNLKLLWDVRIDRTSIAGTIPDALYSLTKLSRLELSETSISGTISSRIGLLTELLELSVADTKISGTLPEDMSKLSKLKHFHANGNSKLVGSIPRTFCSLQKSHHSTATYDHSDIVADCAPSASTGIPSLVCPKECCTKCCDPETKICLDT